jgi:hypothetical protein
MNSVMGWWDVEQERMRVKQCEFCQGGMISDWRQYIRAIREAQKYRGWYYNCWETLKMCRDIRDWWPGIVTRVRYHKLDCPICS